MFIRLPIITALILACLLTSNCSTKCPDSTAISTGGFTGNWLSVTLHNNLEHQLIKLTGVRNYGCYNLAVIATYNTQEQFEKIKGILAVASISKN